MTVEVDFWFDPICPWTWITRQWLDDVERVRDIHVRHRLMSLTLLNAERRQAQGEEIEDLVAAWRVLRVLAACEAELGHEAVGHLYRGVGRRLHEEGRKVTPDDMSVVAESVVEAAVPVDITWYDVDDRYDSLICASHAAAMRRAGPSVGSPIIGIGDFAIFGPVVSAAPQGEVAGRLWDAMVLLADVPGFFELKRSRTTPPITLRG
jgi:hypothetical protein